MTQVTIHLFTGCGLAKRHFLASWRRRLEPLQAEEFCLETGGVLRGGNGAVRVDKKRPPHHWSPSRAVIRLFCHRTRLTVLASVWWKMSFCPLILSCVSSW